ncbi:MAG: phosphotransferase [Anaerolineae bacterium]|nr:phosphotransferase [Anaerolineae bacterium]
MPPLQRIGQGRTADVFVWRDGQVIKLYHDGFPCALIEHEYRIARIVAASEDIAPRVFDLVEHDGRPGLIYERLDGPTLYQTIHAGRPWTLIAAARILAEVQAASHAYTAPDLPARRPQIAERITAAEGLSPGEKARLQEIVAQLPDGDTLCHNDLHPNNILVTARGPVAIDWMDASRGDPLADVARTQLLIGNRFCYEQNPVPRVVIRALLALFQAAHLRRYRALRHAPAEGLAAWRGPLAAARLIEGISEERDRLLALARGNLTP